MLIEKYFIRLFGSMNNMKHRVLAWDIIKCWTQNGRFIEV